MPQTITREGAALVRVRQALCSLRLKFGLLAKKAEEAAVGVRAFGRAVEIADREPRARP